METQELLETSEKAHGAGERTIGLTMAIAAALLAVVTMMGHRMHTEEVVLQTKTADGWAFYQAKDSRFHLYSTDAQLAALTGPGGTTIAETWNRKAEDERRQAEDIRKDTERLDEETRTTARRATFFDAAEICLEVSIVLCSIALLTGARLFWGISFVSTAIGAGIGLVGFLRA